MRVRFGDYEMDTAAVELSRRGERVAVQPQVFAVLELLLRNRERVVSKEELLDEVWGDRFVGESTLASRIKFARRAAGDDGNTQAVIRTVHGRGYRFVAEVTALDTDDASAPGAAPIRREAVEEPMSPTGDAWPFVGRRSELAEVIEMYDRAASGGAIVEAPPGGGTTRFVDEVADRLAARGDVEVWIAPAQLATSRIPLGTAAPLVPAITAPGDALADDVVRADLFRRAYDELFHRAGDRRPLLLTDDLGMLDPISGAVFGSLIDAKRVFGLGTGRPGLGRTRAFENLTRRGSLRVVTLGPLSEIDVHVLLYRALGGPVDEASLRDLVATARGRPGVLRDVVDASMQAGVRTKAIHTGKNFLHTPMRELMAVEAHT